MKTPQDTSAINPLRLLGKALLWFLLFNLLTAAAAPDLGQISGYNLLYPGRARLPFGENPAQSYNISLFDLNAMFKSLALDGARKAANEYRILTVGDSSVWGTLLRTQETLAGNLDARGLTVCGKQARVYNLGYPSLSLTKDLMLLQQGLQYRPDLIIWLTTLEAFPQDKQLSTPLVANNPARIRGLIRQYRLPLDPQDPALLDPGFFDKTILGQRQSLMNLARLQLLGVLWGATGIDQYYPASYTPAAVQLSADQSYHGLTPANYDEGKLAFDLLQAGTRLIGGTPILLVNEPMLISAGTNSELRYNFFYPRWIYDRYRDHLGEMARANGWQSLDAWDTVPAGEFTNSAIHLTPRGESLLADKIAAALPGMCR